MDQELWFIIVEMVFQFTDHLEAAPRGILPEY